MKLADDVTQRKTKEPKKHQTITLPYHEPTKQRQIFTGFYTEVNPDVQIFNYMAAQPHDCVNSSP